MKLRIAKKIAKKKEALAYNAAHLQRAEVALARHDRRKDRQPTAKVEAPVAVETPAAPAVEEAPAAEAPAAEATEDTTTEE